MLPAFYSWLILDFKSFIVQTAHFSQYSLAVQHYSCLCLKNGQSPLIGQLRHAWPSTTNNRAVVLSILLPHENLLSINWNFGVWCHKVGSTVEQWFELPYSKKDFISWLGRSIPCRVCMFSQCLLGFSPDTLASSHNRKACKTWLL